MEAFTQIETDARGRQWFNLKADCTRSGLGLLYPDLKGVSELNPSNPKTSKISGSNQEMLGMIQGAWLNHQEVNLKFKIQKIPSTNTPTVPRSPKEKLTKNQYFDAQTNVTSIEGSPKKRQVSNTEFDVERLMELLKDQIDQVKSFTLRKTPSTCIPGTFLASGCVKIPSNLNPESLTDKDLFSLCTESKEVALGFQGYLAECSEAEARHIANNMASLIPQLASHQFGNYAIQRLALRDSEFEKALVSYCTLNFRELIHNEFASRVVQSLIESRPSFHRQALTYFSNNLDKGIETIPSTHLVVACVKSAKESQSLNFVAKWLRRYNKLIWNKCFQKVLSAYIQICSQSELNEIYVLSKVENKLPIFLNCKMSTYFMANMLMRNHEPTIVLLFDMLNRHPRGLFESKCWRVLLAKLWDEGKSEIVIRLALALASLGKSQIKNLKRSPSVLYFYMYITLKSMQIAGLTQIDDFVRRKDLLNMITNLISTSASTFSTRLF